MGPKKKKGNTVIDGVDTSSMSREQLEKFAINLRNSMDREREERNFFQLERDKLRTFWEITRNQLEEARTQIRAKEREVQVTQELTELDIKHTTQQMKHLQYENQTRIGEIRAEAMTQLKLAQEDHGLQELELLNDKRELRRLLREKEEMTELQIQQLKMKQSELLSEERAHFKREADKMTELHEMKLQDYIKEAELKHRMEMSEVEERKSMLIQNLIDSHDKSFMEMKNYYNDITLSNLGLISSLKEEMEDLRKQSQKNEKISFDVTSENRKLTESMKSAQIELVELRKQLEYFNRDRAALARIRTQYTTTVKQLNDMKWETEVLIMRSDKLTEERNQLKEKFEEAILEIQQKTSLKTVLLERKIRTLEMELEKREATLDEVLTATGGGGGGTVGGNLEPMTSITTTNFNGKMEKLLTSKNEQIQDLRYELARVCKAHDDLLATYEAKMIQFGIPKEELGFEPIRSMAITRLMGARRGSTGRAQKI